MVRSKDGVFLVAVMSFTWKAIIGSEYITVVPPPTLSIEVVIFTYMSLWLFNSNIGQY